MNLVYSETPLLIAIVAAALYLLLVYAFTDCILALLDIEENTRQSARNIEILIDLTTETNKLLRKKSQEEDLSLP